MKSDVCTFLQRRAYFEVKIEIRLYICCPNGSQWHAYVIPSIYNCHISHWENKRSAGQIQLITKANKFEPRR
jgi:hypothetical protein